MWSKVIEKAVASRLNDHLVDNHLNETFQSVYRALHSTETSLLKVKNDIMCALDQRRAVFVLLLDLSAAFDTVDYHIFLKRLFWHILHQWYGPPLVLLLSTRSTKSCCSLRIVFLWTYYGLRTTTRFGHWTYGVFSLHSSSWRSYSSAPCQLPYVCWWYAIVCRLRSNRARWKRESLEYTYVMYRWYYRLDAHK